MGISRRALLRSGGSALLAAPFAAAQFVTADQRPDLPAVAAGDVLTADAWNAVVQRVNELGRRPV